MTGARPPRHRLDGPADAPVVVLGPSLGTSMDLWLPQLPALTREWRVLRYDLPGHGNEPPPDGSSSGARPLIGGGWGLEDGPSSGARPLDGGGWGLEDGPFTVEDLADGIARLLDDLGIDRAAYAGVSLGGAVGTALALRAPGRVASLILCCTSPRFGGPGPWRERAALVRREGVGPVADTAAGRWFTPSFTGAGPYVAMLRATDPRGYAACCDALAEFDATGRLGGISAPTLVIGGARDLPTPPDGHADRLAAGIPGARLTIIEDAGHLAGAERPGPVTEAITAHLDRTWKGTGP